METIKVKDSIYKFKIEEHAYIKELLLNSIKSMGTHELRSDRESISNTDWHLKPDYIRPYYDIAFSIIENYINKLDLSVTNYWFQQYEKGDYHKWHIHAGCNYSSIYYLELPNTDIKTSFKDIEDIKVEEGDFLIFPAHFIHKSKENTHNQRKTSIVFNLNKNDIK